MSQAQSPGFDYLSLLKKYISHVKRSEGVSFIDLDYRIPKHFTDEEWKVLRVLDGSSEEAEDQASRDVWRWRQEEYGEENPE